MPVSGTSRNISATQFDRDRCMADIAQAALVKLDLVSTRSTANEFRAASR
jgi:hypothetical protein